MQTVTLAQLTPVQRAILAEGVTSTFGRTVGPITALRALENAGLLTVAAIVGTSADGWDQSYGDVTDAGIDLYNAAHPPTAEEILGACVIDPADDESDEEPDREPSAEQERAWDAQYDGTSLGA